MMDLFTIRLDDGLERYGAEVSGFMRSTGVLLVAQAAKDEMLERADKGLDIRGRGFTPYAESTIARKKRKGQRTKPVSMRDTEEMLEGIRYVNGVLEPTEAAQLRAGVHNRGEGKMPKREWWGVTRAGTRAAERLIAGVLSTGKLEATYAFDV